MADKKEIKGLIKKILDKITVNQARIFSIVVTALVLLLFLATTTGRNVLTFLAYVGFAAGALYGGYKLYKYTTENAHGVPKERKPKKEEAGDFECDDDYDPFVGVDPTDTEDPEGIVDGIEAVGVAEVVEAEAAEAEEKASAEPEEAEAKKDE